MNPRISLSPKAVTMMNRMLMEGKRIQIDYDPRTGELKIYEVPRIQTVYRVVISG